MVVSAPDPSKSGGAIPPPPPPPPPPPEIPTKGKIQNSSVMPMNQPIVNPYALDAQKKNENPEMNNTNVNGQQSQPQSGPVDFQTMLRNKLQQEQGNKGNVNMNMSNNADVGANTNIVNNNPNSVDDLLHTEADNKNPLAPVIRGKNIVLNKNNVNLNAFLGGVDFLGGDDDDDDDVLSSNLFRRKQTQLPNKNPLQEMNAQMNQNLEPNAQLNRNSNQPMMIMGMPRPQVNQELNQPQINNQQQMQMPPQQSQIQMIKPPQLQAQMPQEQII